MYRLAVLTLFFIVTLVLIIVSADIGVMPQSISALYAFPYGDVIGHFILMGLFSFFVNLSLSCKSIKPIFGNILLGNAIVFLIVTAEELSQLLFTTRSFSFLDLAASYVGIFAFGRLAVLLRKLTLPAKSVP